MLRNVTLNPCARVENVSATSRMIEGISPKSNKRPGNRQMPQFNRRLQACVDPAATELRQYGMQIRAANTHDADSIWAILEPTVRSGETHTLPVDIGRDEAL